MGCIHLIEMFIVRTISVGCKDFFYYYFSEHSLLDYIFTLTFILEK